MIFGLRNYNFLTVFILIFEIPLSIAIYLWHKSTKGISFVQDAALKVIQPKYLLPYLRPYIETIKDKLIAYELWQNLENTQQYGVMQALGEIIVLENKPRFEMIWVIITAVALAIFQVIYNSFGQFFLQDIVYMPYVKPLLCAIKLTTCQ